MDDYNEPIVDHLGKVMFWCESCGSAMTRSDIEDLGLRAPDYGETAQDYLDAELVDSFRHPRCLASKAG